MLFIQLEAVGVFAVVVALRRFAVPRGVASALDLGGDGDVGASVAASAHDQGGTLIFLFYHGLARVCEEVEGGNRLQIIGASDKVCGGSCVFAVCRVGALRSGDAVAPHQEFVALLRLCLNAGALLAVKEDLQRLARYLPADGGKVLEGGLPVHLIVKTGQRGGGVVGAVLDHGGHGTHVFTDGDLNVVACICFGTEAAFKVVALQHQRNIALIVDLGCDGDGGEGIDALARFGREL